MQLREIGDFLGEIGYWMISYGADIHRVEDTICRVARAYEVEAEVFAIPESLVMTVSDAGGESYTRTRRMRQTQTNLDRVAEFNSLARYLCAERPALPEIREKIAAIQARPVYSDNNIARAAMLCAAAFAFLFGGGWFESIHALIAAGGMWQLRRLVARHGGNDLVNNIIGGFWITAYCQLIAVVLPAFRADIAIMSALMLLVPGLCITNAMRDFIAGDFVTGGMKATEGLLIASGIAIGVMLALTLQQFYFSLPRI